MKAFCPVLEIGKASACPAGAAAAFGSDACQVQNGAGQAHGLTGRDQLAHQPRGRIRQGGDLQHRFARKLRQKGLSARLQYRYGGSGIFHPG